MLKQSVLNLLLSLLFLSSCSSFFPIKTAHKDTPIEATDTRPERDEAAPTPATAQTPTQVNNPNSDGITTPVQVVHKEELKLSQLDLTKFAYELGLDPKNPLTEVEKKQILDRKKLRELERSLDSQKERLQYSRVLPWLKDDQEKIQMLQIPSVEGRQVWINKNKIWSRAQNLTDYDEIVDSQDIAMGMPSEYVKKSWGEPTSVEVSGNPIYRNERWQYNNQISTPQGYKQQKRFVYFEGGRVVGWETE